MIRDRTLDDVIVRDHVGCIYRYPASESLDLAVSVESRGRGYMQQYLNEFDFRYNNRKVNDSERTMAMLKSHGRKAVDTTGTKTRFGVESKRYHWQSKLF